MNFHDSLMVGAGVVTTLIITGTVRWLFGLFDAVVPISKAPDKLRAVLGVKANRSLLWASVLLLFQIGNIVVFALDKSPITRLSILYGAMMVCISFLGLSLFALELQPVLRERRRAKAAESATAPR